MLCPRYSMHLQYDALYGYEKLFIPYAPFSSQLSTSE